RRREPSPRRRRTPRRAVPRVARDPKDVSAARARSLSERLHLLHEEILLVPVHEPLALLDVLGDQPRPQDTPNLEIRLDTGHQHDDHPQDQAPECHGGERHAVDGGQPQPEGDPLSGVERREPHGEDQDHEDPERAQESADDDDATLSACASRPLNLAPVVASSSTCAYSPIRASSPSKTTTLARRVRPSTCPASRAVFSIRTSSTRPTSRRLISAWIPRLTSMSSARRAWPSPGSMNASVGSRVAGVPSRGEYRYVNASSKRT